MFFVGPRDDRPVHAAVCDAIGRSRSIGPLSYVALAIVGWIGLVVRVVELAAVNADEAILPARARASGSTALGLILLSRAAYEIAREPAYR